MIIIFKKMYLVSSFHELTCVLCEFYFDAFLFKYAINIHKVGGLPHFTVFTGMSEGLNI